AMDDVARLELGFAEDVGGPLADDQARQGQDVFAARLVEAFGQPLGVGFLFGGQADERHGSPRWRSNCPCRRAFALSCTEILPTFQLLTLHACPGRFVLPSSRRVWYDAVRRRAMAVGSARGNPDAGVKPRGQSMLPRNQRQELLSRAY